MADLRLAAGLLAYLLAFLAAGELPQLLHPAINFFSPEGSLVFGLGFALLVASPLIHVFARHERSEVTAFWL